MRHERTTACAVYSAHLHRAWGRLADVIAVGFSKSRGATHNACVLDHVGRRQGVDMTLGKMSFVVLACRRRGFHPRGGGGGLCRAPLNSDFSVSSGIDHLPLGPHVSSLTDVCPFLLLAPLHRTCYFP